VFFAFFVAKILPRISSATTVAVVFMHEEETLMDYDICLKKCR
jgi:hypothetical protein